MVQLTNASGTVTKTYVYDAFGVEKGPSDTDTNPVRYAGEYYDKETGTYYLQSRYYDPVIARFTQEDTHWGPGNSIYGDNPQKINEHNSDDPLGLNTYTYVPDAIAIMQSGNLYVYCINNPVKYYDPNGNDATAILEWGEQASQALDGGGPLGALGGLVVLVGSVIVAGGALVYDAIHNAKSGNNNAAKSIGGSTPANPNPGNGQKYSLKKITGKNEANKVAQKNGYKNAEALKDEFAPGNGAKFNICRDTKTGELILQSIKGNVQIPTGLYG